MKKLLSLILLGAIGLIFSFSQVSVGSTLNIAGTTYNIAGNGITSSATSVTLQSLTIPQTGALVTDAMLSDTFYLTLEPGSKTKQEIISCTTVTQNAGGTATLSGCARGLLPFSPYTASSTYAFVHAGGSQVIFSDPPQLFEQYFAKGNSETLTGQNTFSATTTFATTTSASSTITNLFSSKAVFAEATSTYAYISSVLQALSAIITTLTTDALTVNTSASLPATTFTGAPTWASDPTNNDHLVRKSYADGLTFAGVASSTENNTGSSRIATKAQASAGTSADSVGNRLVLPASMATSTSQVATTSVVVTNTSGKIDSSFLASSTSFSIAGTSTAWIGAFPAYQIGKNYQIITTTGTSTFTVPQGITKLHIKLVGGGGSGGGANSSGSGNRCGSGGAGAGGYSEGVVDVSATTSVQVYVGSGGQQNNWGESGQNGGWTTFGTNGYFMYANGGIAGSNGCGSAGSAGGTASGGSVLNITGGTGGYGSPLSSSGIPVGGYGGSSLLGQGGPMIIDDASTFGNNSTGYGGGGGGSVSYYPDNYKGGVGTQGIIIISW